jgi:hypothetical protein
VNALICDQCDAVGEGDPSLLAGWLLLEHISNIFTLEQDHRPHHFCSWRCVFDFARTQV